MIDMPSSSMAEAAAKEPRDVHGAARCDHSAEAVPRSKPSDRRPSDLRTAYARSIDKQERQRTRIGARRATRPMAPGPCRFEDDEDRSGATGRRDAFKKLEKSKSCAARSSTPATRIDGRGLSRPCARSSAEVGILPRTSRLGAVHPRRDPGDRNVTTLGTGEDEQICRRDWKGTYKNLHAAL